MALILQDTSILLEERPELVVSTIAALLNARGGTLFVGKELASLIGRRSTTSQRWERLPALGFELQDLDEGQIAETAQEARERSLYEWWTALPCPRRGKQERFPRRGRRGEHVR